MPEKSLNREGHGVHELFLACGRSVDGLSGHQDQWHLGDVGQVIIRACYAAPTQQHERVEVSFAPGND